MRDPDKDVMEKAYARWAPVYDTLCGPVFLSGRRAAAAAAREVGGRILEIGVGTGLSFDDYDAHHRDHRHRHVGADDRAGAGAGGERALSLRQGARGDGRARP